MLYNCCVRIKFWIDFLYVFAVEAYTASWIEIRKCLGNFSSKRSRLIQPRGLKWYKSCSIVLLKLSRLIQPRGLKSWLIAAAGSGSGRGLYSLVDWNCVDRAVNHQGTRRGLYSLVDWNPHSFLYCHWHSVEAYTASWIEITYSGTICQNHGSRLIQPRGLKLPSRIYYIFISASRLIQPRGLKYNL